MPVTRVRTRYNVSIYRHASDSCEVALSEFTVANTAEEVAAILSEEPAGSGFLAIVECRCLRRGVPES